MSKNFIQVTHKTPYDLAMESVNNTFSNLYTASDIDENGMEVRVIDGDADSRISTNTVVEVGDDNEAAEVMGAISKILDYNSTDEEKVGAVTTIVEEVIETVEDALVEGIQSQIVESDDEDVREAMLQVLSAFEEKMEDISDSVVEDMESVADRIADDTSSDDSEVEVVKDGYAGDEEMDAEAGLQTTSPFKPGMSLEEKIAARKAQLEALREESQRKDEVLKNKRNDWKAMRQSGQTSTLYRNGEEESEDFTEACKDDDMEAEGCGGKSAEHSKWFYINKNKTMKESEDGMENSDEFQESSETVTEIADEEYKESVPGVEDKPTFEDGTDTYVDAEACNKDDESFKESVPGITEQPDYTANQVEVHYMVPEADPVGI